MIVIPRPSVPIHNFKVGDNVVVSGNGWYISKEDNYVSWGNGGESGSINIVELCEKFMFIEKLKKVLLFNILIEETRFNNNKFFYVMSYNLTYYVPPEYKADNIFGY